MTNDRKIEVFNELLWWIYYHTKDYGIDEYVNALENCGFTNDEIREELEDLI